MTLKFEDNILPVVINIQHMKDTIQGSQFQEKKQQTNFFSGTGGPISTKLGV